MDNLSSLDGAPNMNKICRTCLLENEEMEPIFGDIQSNEFAFSYQAMLMSCANLQIEENDGLPSNICHQCIADVSQAFTFKNQSEQSQLALERYIGKNTESINTIFENPDTKLNSDMSEDGEYVEIYQETENDAAENIKVITARPFKCDFCPKYFKNQYEYQRHCNIHLGIKFPCRNCRRIFTQESARNLHMRKVHKIRVKKESLPDVLVTREQKKREILYNVPLPTSKPPQQKDSNAELLLPNEPLSLDCQFCMKHFKNQYELLRHTNIHTGVKFRCLCCDKKFTQGAARNKHIRKTHGLSVKKKQKTVQDMTNVLYLERENDYIVESNTEDVIPALDAFQNGNLLQLNNDYVSVEVIDTDNNDQFFDLTNVKEEYVDANNKDSLQNDNLADPNHQWNCEICSKNVLDKAALIIHLQEHMSLSSTFPPQIEECLDFQCLQCPEQFKTNLSLNAHMHSHKKTKHKANGKSQHLKHRALTHHCHVCNKRFKYHSKLIAHLKVHQCDESVTNVESVIDENNLGFRCAYCYKIYTTTNDLRAHVRIHKGQKHADVYSCTYCNIGYPTQGLFINHTMLYHSENLVKKGGLGDVLSNECVLINKNVQSLDVRRTVVMGENRKTNLNYIIQDSSDNDCFITLSENKEQDRLVMDNLASFQCDICLVCFENREKLMAHKKDLHVTRPGAFNTIDKKFTCGICGRGFTKHVYMKRHMLVHTNVKSECSKPGCPKLFPNNGLLMDRKDCQHSAADESTEVSGKLLCTKCGDELTSKRKLAEHLKRHFNQRDFPCTFCDKKFFTKSTLVVHTRIHTNEKPYMCQYCGKGFAQYGDMKLHVRWHTGERPYQCNQCDRRFTTSGNRKDHEATHFTDKKYQCSHCDKTFKAQRTLKIHYRQHTGEKPYMCEICGRAFRRKHHVRIHMKVHGETVTESLPKVLPLFVTEQDILFG